MSWLYMILVWLCVPIVILTKGTTSTFFLGLQTGILVGQIIKLLEVIKDNHDINKEMNKIINELNKKEDK